MEEQEKSKKQCDSLIEEAAEIVQILRARIRLSNLDLLKFLKENNPSTDRMTVFDLEIRDKLEKNFLRELMTAFDDLQKDNVSQKLNEILVVVEAKIKDLEGLGDQALSMSHIPYENLMDSDEITSIYATTHEIIGEEMTDTCTVINLIIAFLKQIRKRLDDLIKKYQLRKLNENSAGILC